MNRIIFSLVFVVCGYYCVELSEFEELPNDILFRFEKSLSNIYDYEVRNAINALNVTLQKFTEFQKRSGGFESRDATINSRIGVFLFTRYCGPGARFLNRIFKTNERTYARIDSCCRMHDECDDYVRFPQDYDRYPELDMRPQFFSRLVCNVHYNF